MPMPSPEEAAANRARLNRKPDGAVIVPAPYNDLITVEGQRIAKGTPVWRYVSGRQYGGPSDAYIVSQNSARIVEYAYRTLESAARMGWKDDNDLCDECGMLEHTTDCSHHWTQTVGAP